MNLKRTLLTAIMAAVPVTMVLAGEAKSGKDIRVGDLVRGLTQVAAENGPETAARVASQLDRSAAAGRSDSLLTEGAAVEILRSLGLDARTAAPVRNVSQGKLDAILLNASSAMAGAARGASAGAPPTTSASLDDCLTQANHGLCVECCKATGLRANACAKACFVINKPSPSEPLP